MRKILYIFGVLSDSDVEWIAQAGVRHPVKNKDVLIYEGVPIDSIILLLEGKISVTVKGVGEVARLGVGEVLGEMSLVDSAPPAATVTAIDDGLALFINKEMLSQKLEMDIGFGYRFYRALAILLADRLRGVERRMVDGDDTVLDEGVISKDEVDIGVLDNLSMAGDRFDRMLKKMIAGR